MPVTPTARNSELRSSTSQRNAGGGFPEPRISNLRRFQLMPVIIVRQILFLNFFHLSPNTFTILLLYRLNLFPLCHGSVAAILMGAAIRSAEVHKVRGKVHFETAINQLQEIFRPYFRDDNFYRFP